MSLLFCRSTTTLFSSRFLPSFSHHHLNPRFSTCPSHHHNHNYNHNHNTTIPITTTPITNPPKRYTHRHSVPYSFAQSSTRKKVGAVIIGNEILNGKTVDKNLGTLARHVENHGAVLEKAVTIRDDIDIIADHVRQMSTTHDLVFTSGGIGPTLDDVTYAGVAAAFQMSLSLHDETIQRMKQSRPSMDLNPARLRMAQLPTDCEILWTKDLWVPLAVVKNVYILPGIPKMFENMLQSIPTDRFGTADRRARVVVLCEMSEGDLAELLENVSRKYESVALGSYPATTEEARQRYKSMITLEGDDSDDVCAAAEIVKNGVNGRYEREAV